jgi:predicted small secreted protein
MKHTLAFALAALFVFASLASCIGTMPGRGNFPCRQAQV